MNNPKKKILKMYITPKGRTDWLKVFTPDKKFDDAGIYGGKLVMDNSDAQDIMAELDALYEKAIDAAVEETGKPRDKIRTTDPYSVCQETGDVSIKLKLKAKVTNKSGDSFDQKPTVVDASRRPITKEIPLWNGSLVRVGYQVIPYYTALAGAGLSLRMKHVQVLEALAGGNDASSLFDDEDGYSYDSDAVSDAPVQQQQEATGEFLDDVPF